MRGGGRKIVFNTNHYMRGRKVEAEWEGNPLRNRRVQFSVSASKPLFVLKKWQIRLRLLRVCMNIPVVAGPECQNLPASAPQPLRAYVSVASGTNSNEILIEIRAFLFQKLLLKILSAK